MFVNMYYYLLLFITSCKSESTFFDIKGLKLNVFSSHIIRCNNITSHSEGYNNTVYSQKFSD